MATSFYIDAMFYLPTDWGDNYCGGITHEIVYDSGDWDGYVVYDSDGNVDLTDVAPTDQTTMNTLFAVSGNWVYSTNTIDSTWEGTHYLKVRAYNGNYLYSDSALIEVTFYNPCEDTTLSCTNTISSPIINTVRSGVGVSESYSNCGDSISTTLSTTSFATANKYICGERTHYLSLTGSNAVNYPNTYSSVTPFLTYTWDTSTD